jgi:hypothetical protein
LFLVRVHYWGRHWAIGIGHWVLHTNSKSHIHTFTFSDLRETQCCSAFAGVWYNLRLSLCKNFFKNNFAGKYFVLYLQPALKNKRVVLRKSQTKRFTKAKKNLKKNQEKFCQNK